LGFTDLREYLTDRYTDKAWTIPQVAAELGVGEHITQRLLRSLG
jgi:transposase